MIYSDISKIQPRWKDFGITVINQWMASAVFINQLEALETFCDFMIDMYVNPSLLSQLQEKYSGHLKRGEPGGVCDMTGFSLYRCLHPEMIADTITPEAVSVFDYGFTDTREYEVENGVHRIIWKENLPYGVRKSNGELVQFDTLHFQGQSKELIKNYYTGSSLPLYVLTLERLISRAAEKMAGRK